MTDINEKLLNLYASKWETLCKAIKPILEDESLEIKPACPLLIRIGDVQQYQNADIRLVVYGQETNGWGNGQFQTDIQSVLDTYDSFFNQGKCWSYGGQFWPGVKRFLNNLQEEYPNRKISLVWNNIVKIGKDGEKGFPPDYIYEIEREHFSIIREELKILKPTAILFLTGPNYDSTIKDNLGELSYTTLLPFTGRQLSRIELSGVPFTFRTYHPNYLWRNDIDSYFEQIINKINLTNPANFFLKSLEQLHEELKNIKERKDKLVTEQKYEEVARLRDLEKKVIEALEYKE